MAVTDITSANATVLIQVEGIIPVPTQLHHFSTDGIAQAGTFTVAEARMGVDGYLAAGQTPKPAELTITLEANTPSERLLDSISKAMQREQTIFNVTITIRVPALKSTFVYTDGVLIDCPSMNNLGTTIDKTAWKFTFAKLERQNY